MTSFYSSSLSLQGRAPLSATSELARFLQTVELNMKDVFSQEGSITMSDT